MSSLPAGPERAVDHAAHPPGGDTPRTAVEPHQDRMAVLERQVEGLTRALHSRDEIGQAKGILIAHYGISADDAFALLVRLSQHTNTKLAEIAHTIVAGVRECGPAHPQQCRVVTEVLEGLLARSQRAALELDRGGTATQRPRPSSVTDVLVPARPAGLPVGRGPSFTPASRSHRVSQAK